MYWLAILVIVLIVALAIRVLLPTMECSRFSIIETPFTQTALSSQEHHLLLSILQRIDSLMKEVPYFLIGGSLMGAIRYGNRMPWDDDIDIGVFLENIEQVVDLPYESKGLKIRKSSYGYKVYDAKFNKSKMLETTFPFVDIFVYQKDGNNYIMSNEKARKQWPLEQFSDHTLLPLTTCRYGNMNIPCPFSSIKFLDQAYPGWDRIAYINGSHTGGLLYRNYSMPINEETTAAVLLYLSSL
jgi:phosphorylcholine metabolism protein LicD